MGLSVRLYNRLFVQDYHCCTMKPLAEIKINGKKIEIDYTQYGLLVAIRLGRILHTVTFFVPGLVCAG